MKGFIKKLLREAILSKHWVNDSYPVRILDSSFSDLGVGSKKILDDRINNLKGLEFDTNANDKIGVWLFKSPVGIVASDTLPHAKSDIYLLAIINGNTLTTLYWKHKLEGQYDFDISYDDLIKFSKSEFYDVKTKPINIKNIMDWRRSNTSKLKDQTPRDKFKKLTLLNGLKVKYYEDNNTFKTLDDKLINNQSIFRQLPTDEIKFKVFGDSDEDTKLGLLDVIPEKDYEKFEALLERIKK